MLEKFSDQIKELTPGQRWRFKKFLYSLELREHLDEEDIDGKIAWYLKEELGLKLVER